MRGRLYVLLFAACSLLGGCADVRSRDCWFTSSRPIDYTEVLRPPPDPLLDLFTLPYSPCELIPGLSR